ncbi:MAG: hypothetical protein JXQ87_14905 [Bacteroidia bacterium]
MKSAFLILLLFFHPDFPIQKRTAAEAADRILELVKNKSFKQLESEFLSDREFFYKKYPGAPPGVYWDIDTKNGFELCLGENSSYYKSPISQIQNDTVNYLCYREEWNKKGVFVSKNPDNFNIASLMEYRNKYENGDYSIAEITLAKMVKSSGFRVVVTEYGIVFWIIEINDQWQLYAIDYDVFCSV